MITNFQWFGPAHILSLFAAALIGTVFIVKGVKLRDEKQRAKARYLLAAVLILVRGSRYIMDVFFGVFEWPDLFSLHICHIDLILLVVCLIRPNKSLFAFCFLIGIPTALSVALFPGSNHPAPGLPRAVLFIMSHTLLVMGALYLAVTHRMKPTLRSYLLIAGAGNIGLILVYFLNKLLGTNFLYIMQAPKGTVIASLEKTFGWPGYVLVLDVLALALMLLMLLIGTLLHRVVTRGKALDSAPPI
jgi:hypothetical integral membrane protein (TIGR02206 family)